MKAVVVPVLGEGIEHAVVSYWFAAAGSRVALNEDIVELSTDKATFNVPSPAAGVLVNVLAAEGAQVAVGSVIAVIDDAA